MHVGSDLDVATAFARDVLSADGAALVVEAYLDGPEVSLFALSDGTTVVPLLPAQDFKRVGDGDTGPNTGGMGAYAPLPWLPAGTVEQVQREVLQPVVDEMAPSRHALRRPAVRRAGHDVDRSAGHRVQLPLRRSRDAGGPGPAGDAVGRRAARRRHRTLAEVGPLSWRDGAAVTVVVAAEGYPGTPAHG